MAKPARIVPTTSPWRKSGATPVRVSRREYMLSQARKAARQAEKKSVTNPTPSDREQAARTLTFLQKLFRRSE
jgi:hypothetical protein